MPHRSERARIVEARPHPGGGITVVLEFRASLRNDHLPRSRGRDQQGAFRAMDPEFLVRHHDDADGPHRAVAAGLLVLHRGGGIHAAVAASGIPAPTLWFWRDRVLAEGEAAFLGPPYRPRPSIRKENRRSGPPST
jgi:hypothetical protein